MTVNEVKERLRKLEKDWHARLVNVTINGKFRQGVGWCMTDLQKLIVELEADDDETARD